ncbi:YdeI/OmpD-associated family protein [Flagellimonas sp. HMM57]|uniref:YdeI/OmpD-associated family protein n=1 Tax=unclassified Flagellimonas TaxID=2644544 RepID=UPI001F0A4052|nr:MULTISPECIES: YdeI/OmpD-associated family protein [unclassified Flagellimonas]UII75452.1 YdeI/OmpD-associated family protein [Flagellimonas sp. HMM57]
MQSPTFEISIGTNMDGMYLIAIPMEIAKPFVENKHKRVRVVASFEDRSIEIYAALLKRKNAYFMMFGKKNQKALGIFPNDYFQLQLFEDTSKYGVAVPEEFDAVMLSDYDAYNIFEGLTDGKKRGIIYMITRYKNSQTKIDKTLLLCENLKRGIRDNKELLKPF